MTHDEVPLHDDVPQHERDTAPPCGCRVVSVHTRPPPSQRWRDARTCCGMCCGYTMPVIMSALVTALFVGSEVYFFFVLAQHSPRTAWRIVVCVLFALVAVAMYVPFMWSYYTVTFTSPGFVPHATWRHAPRVLGGSSAAVVNMPAAGTAAAATAAAGMVRRHDVGDGAVAVTVATPHASGSHSATATAAAAGASSSASSLTPHTTDKSSATVVAAADDDEHARQQQQQQHSSSSFSCPQADGSNSAADDHAGVVAAAAAAVHANVYTVTQLTSRGTLRYCKRCAQYKPDDAHHCSTCNRCVYNFDHHCPWINNCVGRNNYKLFLVFLLYSGVAGLTVGVLDVVVLAVVDTASFEARVGWIVLPALLLALGAATMLFYVQHRHLLAQGRSTLDSIIADSGRDTSCGVCNNNNGGGGGGATTTATTGAALTREQRVVQRAQRRTARAARKRRHRQVLLGHEQPWWRRYLPVPVRVDDEADPV